MRVPPNRTVLAALLLLGALGVYSEGIPSRIYGPLFAACGVALAALLWRRPSGRFAARLALAVISAAFALTAADLALRPLIATRLYYRPDERFLRPWPAAPALVRYEPGVAFRGTTYGDLASMARRQTCTIMGSPPISARGLSGSLVAFRRAGITIREDMIYVSFA